MRARGSLARKAGFTLVEAVTALSIVGVLAGVTFVVLLEGMRVFERVRPSAELAYQSRITTDRLRHDLRRLDPANGLIAFAADSLRFRTVDGELIEYRRVGGELHRNGRPLAEGVDELRFAYTATTGGPALAAADVALIGADLAISRGSLTTRLHAAVHPRGTTP